MVLMKNYANNFMQNFAWYMQKIAYKHTIFIHLSTLKVGTIIALPM